MLKIFLSAFSAPLPTITTWTKCESLEILSSEITSPINYRYIITVSYTVSNSHPAVPVVNYFNKTILSSPPVLIKLFWINPLLRIMWAIVPLISATDYTKFLESGRITKVQSWFCSVEEQLWHLKADGQAQTALIQKYDKSCHANGKWHCYVLK